MSIPQDNRDVIRKGQFIVNYLRFKLGIPEEDHPSYLFGLYDEEFEKIEQEYRRYVIAALHSPDGGKRSLRVYSAILSGEKEGQGLSLHLDPAAILAV